MRFWDGYKGSSFLELLAIEQDGESLTLRIKHFSPGAGLAGREAKDESIDHALVRVDGRTAVFEGTGADNPPRVTFTTTVLKPCWRCGRTFVARNFENSRMSPFGWS